MISKTHQNMFYDIKVSGMHVPSGNKIDKNNIPTERMSYPHMERYHSVQFCPFITALKFFGI